VSLHEGRVTHLAAQTSASSTAKMSSKSRLEKFAAKRNESATRCAGQVVFSVAHAESAGPHGGCSDSGNVEELGSSGECTGCQQGIVFGL
jgi:hypothetical protein